MDKDNFKHFTQYLKDALQETEHKSVNGLSVLFEYYTEYPPEGLEDSESDFGREEIDRLARKQFDQIQHRLENSEIEWFEIVDGKWALIGDDEIPLANDKSELENSLNSTESELINMVASKIDIEARKSLFRLYKDKGLKYGTANEKLSILSLIVKSCKSKETFDDMFVECSKLAGKLSTELLEKDSYTFFADAAKNSRSKYEHLEAANFFKSAIESAEACKQTDKRLEELTRSMRIQYQLCGDEEEAAQAFIKENNLNRKTSKGLKKAMLSILGFISDYCQTPWKVVVSGFSLIFLSALVYAICGIKPSGEAVQTLLVNCNGRLDVFADAFYFSVVTFTTLGYGDFSPVDGVSSCLAAVEAVGGLILTSLFLVTLVRKYGR